MIGIDPSELNDLNQRFNEAKQLYERMIDRKGHWFENHHRTGYYSDQGTTADLNSSLRILEELKDALSRKPDRDNWLLHLAGLHWQCALVLFYLGQYKQAASENAQMEALIPQVPSHMWGPSQKEGYRSNYYFLEGELALAKGNSLGAIEPFQESREIDIRLRNIEGLRKCNYYLRTLRALPPKRLNFRKIFLRGAAFLIVAFGSLQLLGKWAGVDVWRRIEGKGWALLGVSIGLGMLAGRVTSILNFDPDEY